MHRHILQLALMISFSISSTWVGVDSKSQKMIKPSVLSSDVQESYIHYEFNGYNAIEVETPNGFENIIDLEGGASIMKVGTPDLDRWSSSIIIPDAGETSIEIISSSYHDFYNVSVAPSKGNFSRSIDPSDVAYEYSDVYTTDAFFPGELAELEDPYIMRDVRGQTIVLYPLQYNPVTQTLRLYTEIDIKVTTVGNSGLNTLNRGVAKKSISKEFDSIYRDMFLNYANDTRFEYLLDEGNMLIISFGDFMDEMQPFVDWKNRKGIPTEMVNVSSVGSNSSSIANYVADYYNTQGLTYLLLVGDIAQIPTPIISGASSDPSYGFISGNDSFSEVIVGRFSANNPAELNTQIERTLTYEQAPTETSHFENALGIASNQGPGYGGYTDNEFNDFLWNSLLSGYTYDNYEGIYDPSGSVSQGMSSINAGVGIINYTGHAGPTGWGNGAPLDVNDVHDLVNTGMLPFVFTVGCNPGEFNNFGECFTEAWMRATDSDGNPTGAIAHVGSTISQSWEPPMHGQWAFNSILTESYGNNTSRSFGGIVANGCMHMNEAQGSSGINETNHWTTFGDPSVLIRTAQPTYLSPIHDDVILIGQTDFVIDAGVDEGLAALSINGQLVASEYISNGIAVLSLEGMDMIPGTLDLVITSFNSYAYETQINVISPDGAYLITTGYELVSETDFDNMISYGDNVQINIVTENVGTFNTSAILVEVTTADEYISITDGSSEIAYAIINQPALTAYPISFTVAGNVLDGHMANFNVNYNTGESDEWSSAFSVEIHATDFQVLNATVLDEDQNGVLDPGEAATLEVDLANLGSAGFMYYPGATILSNSEYINVANEGETWWLYGIDANQTVPAYFEISATPETPLGATASLSIIWGATELSSGWCENMINGCPDPVEFILPITIGLPYDDQLAIPGNLDVVPFASYIEVSWDEPVLFDCDADAPYSDECYAYVIEIDPYCCDYNWDSICEGEYQDCMGREIESIELIEQNETSRRVQEFNPEIFDEVRSREITGYNIFRNDDFIASTSVTVYEDTNIAPSTEYCYYITAMYDTGQSYGSEEVCVDSVGMLGDIDGDGSVSVLDIIIMVNMIFDSSHPDYMNGDVNGDGEVSILDVILVIGIILET